MASRINHDQIYPSPYVFLSKFDYQSFKHIKKYQTLNQGLIDSIYLNLDNKNHVFKLNSFTPIDFLL